MRRSRVLALLLALGSVAGCRGKDSPAQRPSESSAKPAAANAVESSDVSDRTRRPAGAGTPVIWIGLDGLDWTLLDRLAGEGRMPNWKRLTAEGYGARLRSPLPLISPVLWTTAATGLAPDVHGVLDFQEVDPETGRKVPISGASRSVPAVWNLASAAGRKVGVVGWWATHPAEEVTGFFVSDRLSPLLFGDLSRAGAAYPPALESGVNRLATRESKVTSGDLAPYLDMPGSEIETALAAGGGMENPIVALSRILAATRVTQRVARDLYDRELPDLTMVYFAGTDEVGHIFASFVPPRLACASVSEADIARFGRVVDTYYATADAILGQWMRRAEEDGATLVVQSDHGFKWKEDRPCGAASGDWATAAFWHRPQGVAAVWGRGVRGGAERGDASLFDVAPTVLARLGVPGDRRMPGASIGAAFEKAPDLPKRDVSDVAVRRVEAAAMPAAEADEYTRKLLALGYLSQGAPAALQPTGGGRPGMTESAWNNLGTYLRETGDASRAEKAFRKALDLSPGYHAPMFNLAVLYRDRGQTRAAEDWLLRTLASAKRDPSVLVAGWSRDYVKAGKPDAARSLLDRAAAVYPNSEAIARERARLAYRGKDCRGAVAAMARFAPTTRDLESVNDLVLFQTCLADRDAVEQLLERSLAIRPDQPEAARLLEVVRRAKTP